MARGSGRGPRNLHRQNATADFRERVKAVFAALRTARERDDGKAHTLDLAANLVKDWPQSALAFHVLGHAHAALGEAKEALDPLMEAAKRAPNSLDIAFTLARTYAAMEQFDLAVEACDVALLIDNPDDPNLHAVVDSRQLEPSKEERLSVAKQQLWEIRAYAKSRIVVQMARDCWEGMSEEERLSFLRVNIEEMKAYLQGCEKPSEQCQVRDLDVAVEFIKGTGGWICSLCPQCQKVFLTENLFELHVESEHIHKLKGWLSSVPKKIADEQTELIESWTVSPMPTDVIPIGDAEGDNVLSKIRSAVLQLKDLKVLSIDLVDNLVKFTRSWVGKTEGVPQNLSCINLLDHGGLQVLGCHLDLLQPLPRLSIDDGKQDDHDPFVVALVEDAFALSVDIDNNVSRNTFRSSDQDALFSWLSRPLREEPATSWNSMRQDCLAKGTDVLEKLNEIAASLIKQVKLKRRLMEAHMHADYFRAKAKIDVEIMVLNAEVDYLKKKLLKVCIWDYRLIVLPAMKDYLWAKLCSAKKGLPDSDGKVAEENIENRDDSDVLHDDNHAAPSLQEDTAEDQDVNPPEKVLHEEVEEGAKDPESRDSSVLRNVGAEELPGDSEANLKSDFSVKEGLNEVNDKVDEESLESTDNLNPLPAVEQSNPLHEVGVIVDPEHQNVLQSAGLLPRDDEETMGGSEKAPMADTSDFGTISPRGSSLSDFSGSTKGTTNISSNGVAESAYPNSEKELQSLNATLRSLWHLRLFRNKYQITARVIPHFGVSGDSCVMCKLHKTFDAWSDKDDHMPTLLLKFLRISFLKILNNSNVSLKEETNFAVKFTEIVFNMLHTSQTASRVSNNSTEIQYQPTLFSICSDQNCLSHSLFGLRKNGREITYFINVGPSELQNIEMKSVGEVIKSLEKQFRCNTESSAHNHPPHFFTTAFSYPSEKDSHCDVSGLLPSFAATLDISPVYEGLHSECKYKMVSAVFRDEGQDICFAREQDKWRIYDKTVKEFDSWEKVLEGYSSSTLYPQIIFFERVDPDSDRTQE